MTLKPARARVHSRQQLVELLASMVRADSEKHWANGTAMEFLGALASWLEDADGFYVNAGETRDCDQADWQLFADALQAATVYE